MGIPPQFCRTNQGHVGSYGAHQGGALRSEIERGRDTRIWKKSERDLPTAWHRIWAVYDKKYHMVNALMRKINPEQKIVIDDVRFPNEAAAIHAKGGKIVREVVRDNPEQPVDDHISEQGLDSEQIDYGQ